MPKGLIFNSWQYFRKLAWKIADKFLLLSITGDAKKLYIKLKKKTKPFVLNDKMKEQYRFIQTEN